MILIGLIGRKNSGRETIFRFLKEHLEGQMAVAGLSYMNAAMSEMIKALGVSADEISRRKDLYGPILEWWRRDFRRNQNINYWTDRANILIKRAKDLSTNVVVVTDIQYKNEAMWILARGGYLVKVDRPQRTKFKQIIWNLWRRPRMNLENELSEIPYEYVLRNDHDLENLRYKVGLLWTWVLAHECIHLCKEEDTVAEIND